MKRRMVAPEQWGTHTGYVHDRAWAEGLQVFEFEDQGTIPIGDVGAANYQGAATFDGAVVAPHYDHARIFNGSKSWRLWDPLREGQSPEELIATEVASALRPQLTETDGGTGELIEIRPPVTDATGANILGVKGELEFRFSDYPLRVLDDIAEPPVVNERFGIWVDEKGDPLPAPWPQEYNEWPNEAGADKPWWEPFIVSVYDDIGVAVQYNQTRLFMARVPVFVAMYKGTIKVSHLDQESLDANNEARVSIDSGPYDDPATVIGMDITNPGVLESSRVVWWDKFDAWLPVPLNKLPAGSAFMHPAGPVPQLGGPVKYSLSLDRNWRVRKDQVLWLHLMTGALRVPLTVFTGPAQPQYQAGTYHGHPFHVSLHASMLVDGV